MPELPEVEITRRGIGPALTGRSSTGAAVREARLREPVDPRLGSRISGLQLRDVRRRGKYLLLDFGEGHLIIHLGMSGSLRIVPADSPPGPHDHLDLLFGPRALRMRDPRRFGLVVWAEADPEAHRLIAPLGVEPLEATFSGAWLRAASRRSTQAIKTYLMDSRKIVGIGNIYASESLFRARIRPTVPAGQLSSGRCGALAAAIKETLEAALAAGGSTLRDFAAADGSPGYFQQTYFVYGRSGLPCRVCGSPIRATQMGQRSTYYCPRCQR